MTRRALGLSVVVAAGAAAVAVAAPAPRAGGSLASFGSLQASASSVSSGCAKTAGPGLPQTIAPGASADGFALVTRTAGKPLVSAVAGYVSNRGGTSLTDGLASSRGQGVVLGDSVDLVALWPCKRPVAFYLENAGRGNVLWMQAVGARGPVSLGKITAADTVFDSRGRLVAPPRSPLPGWRVARFAPAPARSSGFIAEVERNCMDTPSGQDTGRLYLISRSTSSKLASYDSCDNPPLAAWSPDGATIFWTTYSGTPVTTRFHVAGSSGKGARTLGVIRAKGDVNYALWSPDGRAVAYDRGFRVADITVRTSAVHQLADIGWTPTPPPREPPVAGVVGWSPNSKNVLIMETKPNGAGTTIVSVPARGGSPRVLIRMPQ